MSLVTRYSGSPVQPSRVQTPAPAATADPVRIGWLPALSVVAALGLSLCVAADALSRSTRSSTQFPFWLGVTTIVVPIVFRLSLTAASRRERLSLVVLLGLSLYLVKVVLDPFGFTFGDELLHAPNVNAILHTHKLFPPNSLLPITRYYPGLETVTDGVASMTGLSSFGAGLIVVGAARLLIMVGIYLLFERLSGSSRVAGLGAAIYTANANFLFWSAQFAYESLALPLLIVALVCLAEFRRTRTDRLGWSAASLLMMAAVVITHHVSSYALVSFLIAVSVAHVVVGRKRGLPSPWPFALFALLATVAWLTFVASATVGYLTPIFDKALVSTIHAAVGETPLRHPFGSVGGGPQVPLLERLVGFGSVLLLLLALPFGLLAVWRRHRRDPMVVVLALAGVGFFGTLALRFSAGAWEVANRASEFLFVGLALVVAMAGLERVTVGRFRVLGPILTAACAGVIFAGGVLAGWKPELRLAHPYRVAVGSHVIDAEDLQLARWIGTHLGQARIGAPATDAGLIADHSRAVPFAGQNPDVVDLLQTTELQNFELSVMHDARLDYVVADRRLKSFDNLIGYYFGLRPGAGPPDRLYPAAVQNKFDALPLDRLYDSGDIAVYAVGKAP
jgi:hypothetical protein